MRNFKIGTRAIAGVLLAAPLWSCAAPLEKQHKLADAVIINAAGEEIGISELNLSGDSLRISIKVSGLPAGEKALHLHSVGDCTMPDFKSAGGHLNPFSHSHGKMNPGGQHLGDLENIHIAPAGTTSASIMLSGKPEEILPYIMDSDSTAIMIHAGPDDYQSDPAGAAGPRIACGIFTAR